MSIDPYELCPCGSGKKLKFCCSDLVEPMEKVFRHREHHQPRMALQVLEKIEKQHPGNPWVLIERAAVHLGEDEPAPAKAALDELLANDPKHELGILLRAFASFSADGFDEAKPHIYEALLKCARNHSEMLSSLAFSVGSLMNMAGKHMAARLFLTLAMRLASAKFQQEIFLELLRLDGDRDCPYPLRSVHLLAQFEGAADLKSQSIEASRLADMGCCEPAAEVFTRLAEEQPDNALFWQNAGLCRAWAGDEESAADALHLAAQLHGDFDSAVELETMAQLLDVTNADDVIPYKRAEYRVRSVSKLLSQLSGHRQIVSLPLPPADPDRADVPPPAGLLHICNRELPGDDELDSLTIATIPQIDADVTLFDAIPANDEPARAFVTGLEGERFAAARKLFAAAAGDNVELVPAAEGEDATIASQSIPTQVMPLQWYWYLPPHVRGVLIRELERQQWQQAVDAGWMNHPQEALRGMSPRQAMEDAELKLPLTAAVYTLDALCACRNYALDVDRLIAELRLTPLSTIPVTEKTPLNAFSAMQLNRLDVKRLGDQQLLLTLNRSLLIHHPRFLYDVLREALDRPACLTQINRDRAYTTLVDLCGALCRREEAFEWLKKGAALPRSGEGAFGQQLNWKLRELTLRIEDPDDPELLPLLEQLYTRYASKLPELQGHLDELCELRGIESKWRDAASAVTAGSIVAEGIWSPGAAGQAAGSKLWLPGQS